MNRISLIFLMLLTLLTPLSAQVINGDFETGDFTNWTYDGSLSDPVFVDVFFAETGGFGAGLGNAALQSLTYQFQFATVLLQPWTVTFSLANGDPGNNNYFEAFFDGDSLLASNDDNAFAYAPFTFNGVGSGSLAQLTFSFYNPNDFFSLDNVSIVGATAVAPSSSVPELNAGAAQLPVVFCLMALAVLQDRRRQQLV